jgi:hypothetical protein
MLCGAGSGAAAFADLGVVVALAPPLTGPSASAVGALEDGADSLAEGVAATAEGIGAFAEGASALAVGAGAGALFCIISGAVSGPGGTPEGAGETPGFLVDGAALNGSALRCLITRPTPASGCSAFELGGSGETKGCGGFTGTSSPFASRCTS